LFDPGWSFEPDQALIDGANGGFGNALKTITEEVPEADDEKPDMDMIFYHFRVEEGEVIQGNVKLS